VVVVVDVAMVVEWWLVSWSCLSCVQGRRRSSIIVIKLAWPKRAVTRAFDDDNGGDGGGGKGVEL
jgi:3',5'-cyclic AMP phosphodiesterase CpdA